MKKINIIKKNEEFSRIIHNCRYIKNDLYVIYIEKNENFDKYHFGISVSKKVGNAVTRNKVKRQIKDIIDKYIYQNNFNCIIIVKKEISLSNYNEKKEKLFLVISLSGCTKILKDDKGKAVTNKLTGQNLTENILCKPTDKDILKLYKENNVEIKKLPDCENLKILSGTYDGMWTTIFVKPLAFIIVKLGILFKNYGLAIILITLIIRLIMFPITKKTALQSENMKKAQPELDFLEKKYKNKQDSDSMMMKSQEMMGIYKKYNINPMSGCLFSLIQIPLFFAFYEALNRLPAVFEGKFLGFKMGMSPMNGISSGSYQYIIIIALVILATFLSFKLNSTASMSKEQEGQMKMMTNMMLIFIGIASLSISTGIAIYWITNNTFTIIQNLLVKRSK